MILDNRFEKEKKYAPLDSCWAFSIIFAKIFFFR